MSIIKKAVMFALTGLFALGLTASLSAFAGPASRLQSITVNPEWYELQIGQQVWFYAVGNYSDGSTRTLPANKAYLTSTVLEDGKVLIAGGYDGSSAPMSFDEADLYDPSNGTFSRTGSMTIMRDSHTATRLADGRVLITGGFADAPVIPQYEIIGSAEIYNPATGNFQATGSMSESRAYHTATLLGNGKVLITGGATAGTGEGLATAELYDPTTGTFSPTGGMSTPKISHTATLLANGKVLVVDGGTNVAELYDPSTGTFSDTGPMNFLRYGITATLLENGQVLIAGGMDAELYDPSSNTFTITGSMIRQHDWATSTLLKNGKVLIAGGGTDTAELYDPETGTFSATGTMEGWRYDFTAALLGNGNVLIVGGSLPMAEIYDTQTGVWQNAGYDLGDLLEWSNSDESIAASALNPGVSYYLTGLLAGTTTVTATSGNISGNSQVIVGTPPYVGIISYNSTVLPGDFVQLDGYGSSNNPGGYITSYSWTQFYGIPITLNNHDTATVSFTAPNVEGWLGLDLTVTDSIGMSSGTSGWIYVTASTSTASTTTTTSGGGTTTTTTVVSTTTTTIPDINNGCTTGECDANYFCINCHDGLTVNGYVVGGGSRLCAQRTATEWVTTIDRMNSKGCGVPTVRINRIANYLASLGTGGGSSTAPTTTTTSFGSTTTTAIPTTVATTTTTTVPSGGGATDAANYCTGCHDGLTVTSATGAAVTVVGGGARICPQRTAAEWVTTIDRMNSKGCGVPSNLVSPIANYLAAVYSGTTTTTFGGTTTTRAPTTTTTVAASTTTTPAIPSTTSTTTVTPSTSSTVATTTTTTVCNTHVDGISNYPYTGYGSCHGHNGSGEHPVREEQWCQQHMDHFNSSGSHVHAYPHPLCM